MIAMIFHIEKDANNNQFNFQFIEEYQRKIVFIIEHWLVVSVTMDELIHVFRAVAMHTGTPSRFDKQDNDDMPYLN